VTRVSEVPRETFGRSSANESTNMDSSKTQKQQLSKNLNHVSIAEEDGSKTQDQQIGTSRQQQASVKIIGGIPMREEATQTIRHGHQFSQRDFEEHFYSKTFEGLVSGVETAIRSGVKPELIKQGTSGSYFCRHSAGDIVGVFKPKSEEPYGPANPKVGKKIQRIFCPCMFGRGCLLNHQGYLSEAGAFIVDQKLRLGVVPLTSVAWLSSDSFNYSKSARNKALMKTEINKRYPAIGAKFHRLGLKPKIGSLQQFVRNYKDANVFLNECNDLKLLGEDDRQDFLEQFQRIVVLDYVIRNTDRGPSNWLVRSEAEFTAKKRPKNVNANQFFDEDIEEENGAQEEGEVRWIGRSINKSIATLNVNNSSDANANNSSSANADADDGQALLSESDEGYRTAVEEENLQNKSQNENNTLNLDLQCAASTGTPKATQIDNSCRSANMVERRVTLAAIDNGLAFPYKHPGKKTIGEDILSTGPDTPSPKYLSSKT